VDSVSPHEKNKRVKSKGKSVPFLINKALRHEEVWVSGGETTVSMT
jgi:hypothetical protein